MFTYTLDVFDNYQVKLKFIIIIIITYIYMLIEELPGKHLTFSLKLN